MKYIDHYITEQGTLSFEPAIPVPDNEQPHDIRRLAAIAIVGPHAGEAIITRATSQVPADLAYSSLVHFLRGRYQVSMDQTATTE